MFEQFGRERDHTAGFSARAFLNLERSTGELVDRVQIVDEYREVITQARATLGLPSSTASGPTGWSRGAAFAVLSPETTVSSRNSQA